MEYVSKVVSVAMQGYLLSTTRLKETDSESASVSWITLLVCGQA
jgi:hypothetical protein